MVKIPSGFIIDYDSYSAIEFEIIFELFKRKDTSDCYNGTIDGLLYFTSINNANRKYTSVVKDLIISLGGDVNGKFISIDLGCLFKKTDNDKYTDYLQLEYDSVKLMDRKIFKYYCFLLYNVKMFNNCFIQTYKQLVDKTGISETTLIKYNNLLMNMGLIYFVNSGDMYHKSSKTVINSSNFYSTDLSFATSEMERYIGHTTENYKWSKDIPDKIDSNDKRRATQYIRLYGDIAKDDLTDEQIDKLMWAYELQVDIERIDVKDSDKFRDIKIKSLVKRYDKQGLSFDYDTCRKLLDGEIKIRDLV